ncbi:MAG: XTP/dITP diphosphatase [Thermodesulfobacteriota bacterium]
MKKIVLATGNRGKILEIKEALRGFSVALLTLEDFPGLEMPPEDGSSFEENALIKARYVMKETGIAALADDSGLVVDILSGAPGIHSARYAGVSATDGENIDKLLKELDGILDDKRKASFICALALVEPIPGGEGGPTEKIFTGMVDGVILTERRGANGFGYDPVFYIPKLERTTAELTDSEKLSVSHRGKAIEKFKEWVLRDFVEEGD